MAAAAAAAGGCGVHKQVCEWRSCSLAQHEWWRWCGSTGSLATEDGEDHGEAEAELAQQPLVAVSRRGEERTVGGAGARHRGDRGGGGGGAGRGRGWAAAAAV